MCAIIDAEHAFDSAYAQKLALTLTTYYLQLIMGNRHWKLLTDNMSGAWMLCNDSVQHYVPKSELEGEMEIVKWACMPA